MADIAAALARATRMLEDSSDTARLDAEVLMAHALGVTRGAMLLHHQRDAEPPGFAALVARRCGAEPVAYITGRQEFWGLDLAVTPAVLIPRGDSETLIVAALDHFRDRTPGRVLDCGTGSGALLLAALSEWPEAAGIGIDRSAGAVAVAHANAQRLAMPARVLCADWSEPGWSASLGRFDLVLANPPYVECDAMLAPQVRDHEPHGALFAGAEGLDAYRVLVPQVPGLLAPGGVALFEIGATQAAAVGALARAAGLWPSVHADLAGRPRAVAMVAPDA